MPALDTDDQLAELCAYLRTLRLTAEYRQDEDGGRTTPSGEYTAEASPAAEIAREWARELLAAADANGLSGCRLCRS